MDFASLICWISNINEAWEINIEYSIFHDVMGQQHISIDAMRKLTIPTFRATDQPSPTYYHTGVSLTPMGVSDEGTGNTTIYCYDGTCPKTCSDSVVSCIDRYEANDRQSGEIEGEFGSILIDFGLNREVMNRLNCQFGSIWLNFDRQTAKWMQPESNCAAPVDLVLVHDAI